MDDVPAHGATIPSAPMAEPRPAGNRPAAYPAERTIGQLVGESIRFYGEHFWHVSCARARARGARRRRRERLACRRGRAVADALRRSVERGLRRCRACSCWSGVRTTGGSSWRGSPAGWCSRRFRSSCSGSCSRALAGWRRSGSSSRSSSSRLAVASSVPPRRGSSHGLTTCTRSRLDRDARDPRLPHAGGARLHAAQLRRRRVVAVAFFLRERRRLAARCSSARRCCTSTRTARVQ